MSARRRTHRLRIAAWSAAVLLLLLPLVAMQFTDEVDWDAGDFVFAGVLFLGVGATYELAVRRTGNAAYRAGVGVALGAAVLLVWISAAVGIVGSVDDTANLMYLAVLAVGVAGAFIARFRPRPLARALLATALAQAGVTFVVLVAGLGAAEPPGAVRILIVNAGFIALFAVSAWLVRHAGRDGR